MSKELTALEKANKIYELLLKAQELAGGNENGSLMLHDFMYVKSLMGSDEWKLDVLLQDSGMVSVVAARGGVRLFSKESMTLGTEPQNGADNDSE